MSSGVKALAGIARRLRPGRSAPEASGAERLGEAIVLWTGHGEAAWPDRGAAGEARLRARFGEAEARRLLTEVRRAAHDFSTSDAWITAPDLPAMADQASAEFRARHPDLPEAAISALAWCYTFDFR
jgi:hypothetical protein